jgi:hypothetical protein
MFLSHNPTNVPLFLEYTNPVPTDKMLGHQRARCATNMALSDYESGLQKGKV